MTSNEEFDHRYLNQQSLYTFSDLLKLIMRIRGNSLCSLTQLCRAVTIYDPIYENHQIFLRRQIYEEVNDNPEFLFVFDKGFRYCIRGEPQRPVSDEIPRVSNASLLAMAAGSSTGNSVNRLWRPFSDVTDSPNISHGSQWTKNRFLPVPDAIDPTSSISHRGQGIIGNGRQPNQSVPLHTSSPELAISEPTDVKYPRRIASNASLLHFSDGGVLGTGEYNRLNCPSTAGIPVKPNDKRDDSSREDIGRPLLQSKARKKKFYRVRKRGSTSVIPNYSSSSSDSGNTGIEISRRCRAPRRSRVMNYDKENENDILKLEGHLETHSAENISLNLKLEENPVRDYSLAGSSTNSLPTAPITYNTLEQSPRIPGEPQVIAVKSEGRTFTDILDIATDRTLEMVCESARNPSPRSTREVTSTNTLDRLTPIPGSTRRSTGLNAINNSSKEAHSTSEKPRSNNPEQPTDIEVEESLLSQNGQKLECMLLEIFISERAKNDRRVSFGSLQRNKLTFPRIIGMLFEKVRVQNTEFFIAMVCQLLLLSDLFAYRLANCKQKPYYWVLNEEEYARRFLNKNPPDNVSSNKNNNNGDKTCMKFKSPENKVLYDNDIKNICIKTEPSFYQ